MNARTFAIAFAAGFASAMAVYAAIRSGGLGVPLLSIAALPIYVAALAWGTRAGSTASVVAIAAIAVLISPSAAVPVGLAITIPAAIIGHQANLAQENDQGKLDWYPLSQLLFNLAALLSVGLVIVGFFMDYTAYAEAPELGRAVREYLNTNPPPQPLTDDEIGVITSTVFRLLPFTFASLWLVIHVINLQLGAIVCRASNLLPRPKDDVPGTTNLPRMAVAVLFVALLGTLVLEGGLHAIAAVFAGSFLMAFALVGLAASHYRARINPTNFIFLVLSYILILLFFVPIFLFAIGGLIRCLSNQQTSPPPAGSNKT